MRMRLVALTLLIAAITLPCIVCLGDTAGADRLFDLDAALDAERQSLSSSDGPPDVPSGSVSEVSESEGESESNRIRFPSSPNARTAAYWNARYGGPALLNPESLNFENLPLHELEEHYSNPPSATALHIIDQVRRVASQFVTQSVIDVILVGFDADGETGITIDANELQRYLSHAGLGTAQSKETIRPLDDSDPNAPNSHTLPFSTKHLFRITKAHPSLRFRVQSRLQEVIDSSVESDPYILQVSDSHRTKPREGEKRPTIPTIHVPVHVVQEVIAQHFKESAQAHVGLYILNLAPIYLKERPTTDTPKLGAPETERVRLRYVYTQESIPPTVVNGSTTSIPSVDPLSGSFPSCPTASWTSARDRMIWFDLSAGPVAFGPQSWGDGLVTEYTIPSPARMLEAQNRYARRAWNLARLPVGGAPPVVPPDVPFTPATSLNNHHRHSLLSSLANLVRKVSIGLLNPAADHWPVKFASKLKIHLVYVHERHYGESTVETAIQMAQQKKHLDDMIAALKSQDGEDADYETNDSNLRHLDRSQRKEGFLTGSVHTNRRDISPDDVRREEAAWAAFEDSAEHDHHAVEEMNAWRQWNEIEQQLLSLALPEQEIEVHNHHLRFEECQQCVSALTSSLRTHTSNIVLDHAGQPSELGQPGAHLRTQSTQYLDSNAMKDILEHFEARFWNLQEASNDGHPDGVDPATAPKKDDQRSIRVFIYDLAAPSIILFDRFHQSVSFDDLVLSVQTRAPSALVDYTCDGRTLVFDPRDASRATLGTILTTGWSITPSYQHWSPMKKDTETDFLLTTGFTPYGYFSKEKTINFAIRENALRHMLLSALHASMVDLSQLFPLDHSPPAPLVDELLYSSHRIEFLRRWNVLIYKFTKAQHWLGLNQVNQAWTYVASIRSDAKRLRQLVSEELATLEVTLECGPTAARKAAGLHTSDQESASALLASSHYLFFLILEVFFLSTIVGFFWLVSNHPSVMQPILVRLIPAFLVAPLGLERIIHKRKNF